MKFTSFLAPLALALLPVATSSAQTTYPLGGSTASTLTLSTTIIANGPFAGAVSIYAGNVNTPGTGNVNADGQSLSRTTYPDLFNAIGTTYGSSDSSSFNPDSAIGSASFRPKE